MYRITALSKPERDAFETILKWRVASKMIILCACGFASLTTRIGTANRGESRYQNSNQSGSIPAASVAFFWLPYRWRWSWPWGSWSASCGNPPCTCTPPGRSPSGHEWSAAQAGSLWRTPARPRSETRSTASPCRIVGFARRSWNKGKEKKKKKRRTFVVIYIRQTDRQTDREREREREKSSMAA